MNLLEQRGGAEAALAPVAAAAEEKMRILQEGEGAAYARAEEEAVDAAVKRASRRSRWTPSRRCFSATPTPKSLRRALAASNQGVELWREKAETAADELEALVASDDLARMNDLRRAVV